MQFTDYMVEINLNLIISPSAVLGMLNFFVRITLEK